MRLIAVSSAFLIIFSSLDGGTVAGQTSDALTFESSHSSLDSRKGGGSLAGSSLQARLLTALAGGAVGAGLGFFASQVFTSDWDRDSDDDGIDRRPWAAVGGSIGFAVGFSFPLTGRGGAPQPVTAAPAGGPPAITADEMSGTGVNTAYEAVELLRPQWLTPRGSHTFREDATQRIRAYLDDVELGGVDALREVSAPDILSIYFLDAAASTYRWGAGHSHGAILVLTKGGASRGLRVGGRGGQPQR